jgi:hypothetical protein
LPAASFPLQPPLLALGQPSAQATARDGFNLAEESSLGLAVKARNARAGGNDRPDLGSVPIAGIEIGVEV